MITVDLNQISKLYGSTRVLNQLSLHVKSSERLVIVGASGCGKTTLLRLIAGLDVPDQGQLTIAGKLAAANGKLIIPPEKRDLAMVFQDLALWPHLSIHGNLNFVLRAKGWTKTERMLQIEKMLHLVNLSELANRKPAELSGGQQQRVALARALAPQPKLLLMDEPLASLDHDLNLKMRQEILRLQRELKFTLIYVTHNRDEAASLATRCILIEHGSVITPSRNHLQAATQP